MRVLVLVCVGLSVCVCLKRRGFGPETGKMEETMRAYVLLPLYCLSLSYLVHPALFFFFFLFFSFFMHGLPLPFQGKKALCTLILTLSLSFIFSS